MRTAVPLTQPLYILGMLENNLYLFIRIVDYQYRVTYKEWNMSIALLLPGRLSLRLSVFSQYFVKFVDYTLTQSVKWNVRSISDQSTKSAPLHSSSDLHRFVIPFIWPFYNWNKWKSYDKFWLSHNNFWIKWVQFINTINTHCQLVLILANSQKRRKPNSEKRATAG
jgi:hypothetical protein